MRYIRTLCVIVMTGLLGIWCCGCASFSKGAEKDDAAFETYVSSCEALSDGNRVYGKAAIYKNDVAGCLLFNKNDEVFMGIQHEYVDEDGYHKKFESVEFPLDRSFADLDQPEVEVKALADGRHKVRLVYKKGQDVLKDIMVYLSGRYLVVFERESERGLFYTDGWESFGAIPPAESR